MDTAETLITLILLVVALFAGRGLYKGSSPSS